MNKVPSLKFDWSRSKLLNLLKDADNQSDESSEPLVPDEENESNRIAEANVEANENPHEV